MEKSAAPFNGTGYESQFHTWRAQLFDRMAPYNLSSMEQIMVLKAHTSGDALDVVEVYSSASGANATSTLLNIWEELKRRFGTGAKVSSSLRRQLLDIEVPKSPASRLAVQLRKLRDLCLVIQHNMRAVDELNYFNTSQGQRLVWEKLPE